MPKAIHGFCDDTLGDHDAVALAALVDSGELQISEILEASIARAHQVDPHLHAIVEHCSEQSLERSGGDSSGPFAGVPTFIKDMNDLIGLPTRYGSAAYEGAQAATRNDPVVQQMIDLGFVPWDSVNQRVIPGTPATVWAVPRLALRHWLRQGWSLLLTQRTGAVPSGYPQAAVDWWGSSQAGGVLFRRECLRNNR